MEESFGIDTVDHTRECCSSAGVSKPRGWGGAKTDGVKTLSGCQGSTLPRPLICYIRRCLYYCSHVVLIGSFGGHDNKFEQHDELHCMYNMHTRDGK